MKPTPAQLTSPQKSAATGAHSTSAATVYIHTNPTPPPACLASRFYAACAAAATITRPRASASTRRLGGRRLGLGLDHLRLAALGERHLDRVEVARDDCVGEHRLRLP